MKLIEMWDLIYVYKYNNTNIDIYDSEHAIERFISRHNFDKKILLDKIKLGLDKIYTLNKLTNDYYVIISKSKNLKIPINIRLDRYSNKKIGVIPTILDKIEHPYNKKNEIEVFVEKTNINKKVDIKNIDFMFIPLITEEDLLEKYKNDFNEYIVEGKIQKNYIEIFVD